MSFIICISMLQCKEVKVNRSFKDFSLACFIKHNSLIMKIFNASFTVNTLFFKLCSFGLKCLVKSTNDLKINCGKMIFLLKVCFSLKTILLRYMPVVLFIVSFYPPYIYCSPATQWMQNSKPMKNLVIHFQGQYTT